MRQLTVAALLISLFTAVPAAMAENHWNNGSFACNITVTRLDRLGIWDKFSAGFCQVTGNPAVVNCTKKATFSCGKKPLKLSDEYDCYAGDLVGTTVKANDLTLIFTPVLTTQWGACEKIFKDFGLKLQ
jgi:hypothetical protein